MWTVSCRNSQPKTWEYTCYVVKRVDMKMSLYSIYFFLSGALKKSMTSLQLKEDAVNLGKHQTLISILET